MEKGQMGMHSYIVFRTEVLLLAFRTIKGIFLKKTCLSQPTQKSKEENKKHLTSDLSAF